MLSAADDGESHRTDSGRRLPGELSA
jgi:hypothetical protein